MSNKFSGRCLCNKVTYTCEGDPILMADCYCEDCRKVSGTSHGSHLMFPESALTVTGSVKSYAKAADSGNIVTRFFCPTCASPLYSISSSREGLVVVRASTLEDFDLYSPQIIVYKATAPSWCQTDA